MSSTSDARRKQVQSLKGKVAANTLHAGVEDETAYTAPARAAGPGQLAYHERKIDPDGTMDPEQRRRRAEHAKRAYFAKLALASAMSKRAKRASS